MKKYVCFFNELKEEEKPKAGGKGATLATHFQKGYPVPNGFVILADAFELGQLLPEAKKQIQKCLLELRGITGECSFAVRSSALCEDSHSASFAGQFATILHVRTDEEIFQAIEKVYASFDMVKTILTSDFPGIQL